jgi:transcriptional regulator with XRE-family HTH domain
MLIDYQAIGSRIKSARNKKGLTQAQLAELLQVSPEYVSRLERGGTKISLPTLVEVSGLLSVSPSSFLDGSTTAESNYALGEFSEIVRGMSPDKRKLLLEIAKVLIKEK